MVTHDSKSDLPLHNTYIQLTEITHLVYQQQYVCESSQSQGLDLGQLNGISPVASFDEKSGVSCSNNNDDHHFAYQAMQWKPLERIIKICGFTRSLINKLVFPFIEELVIKI